MKRRISPVHLAAITLPLLIACGPKALQWAGVFGLDLGQYTFDLELDQDGEEVVVERFVFFFQGANSLQGWAQLLVEGCPGVADDGEGSFTATDCTAVATTSFGSVEEFVLTLTGIATQVEDDVVNELNLCIEGAGFYGCDDAIPLPRIS